MKAKAQTLMTVTLAAVARLLLASVSSLGARHSPRRQRARVGKARTVSHIMQFRALVPFDSFDTVFRTHGEDETAPFVHDN
jgi:hypothetical protein